MKVSRRDFLKFLGASAATLGLSGTDLGNDYTYENGGWEGRGRDWNETKRLVKFIHLPRKCTIRVF